MKKSLLLCFVALVWCINGTWAVTGSGTEDDPYVVSDGESFEIPAKTNVYFNFTAPGNGQLSISKSPSLGFFFMVKDSNGSWTSAMSAGDTYVNPVTFTVNMTEGVTYEFYNNTVQSFDACTITVNFVAATDDALDVVSADPEEGATVEAITVSSPITVTLNKEVASLRAAMSDYTFDEVSAVAVEGEENTWTISPTDLSDLGRDNEWTLYEGTVYTLTLTATLEDETTETTTISYNGATPATQYADVKIIGITPDPDETDLDKMLSIDGLNTFTATFDGYVEVTNCVISLGMYGTISVETTVEDNGDGTYAVVGTPSISSDDYNLPINLTVVDAQGLSVNDPTPSVSGVTFSAGTYSFNLPVADGRARDTSLYVTEVIPSDNSYVESLSEVRFTMAGGGDSDGFYVLTSGAGGGVFDENGNKLYDIVLSQDDERGESEFVTSDMGMGGNSVYMPGTTCYMIATICELDTETPVAITTPGTYTLKVDEASIGDGNFEYDSPWLGDLAGTKGRCNPELSWTYNVVDMLVAVESVAPVPYNVSGEYNEEIPSVVTITMNSSDFTVSNATLSYTGATREAADYTVDGNVITVQISEAAQQANSMSVMVYATGNNDAPIAYGTSEDDGSFILLTYQMPRNAFVPTTVTPAAGAVESLSTITLGFDETVGTLNTGNTITLTDAANNVTECSIDYDAADWNVAIISVGGEITAEGTYTLTIPEGTIYNDSYDSGFTDEDGMPEGDLYNPELVYVYSITTTGITSVKADADGNVKVYTVNGVYVGEGPAAQTVNSLPAGVYIVNGTKMVIK